MRKLKTFIYLLISFIFLSCPIKAKASSFALSADAIELLSDGIDMLSYSGSVPYGFLGSIAFSQDANKSYQDVLEDYLGKANIFSLNGTAINARNLTNAEIEQLKDLVLYDEDGNILNLTDIVYAESDNGYFTEHIYCKNDGSPCYLDSAKTNPALDVKFGGSDMSYLEWQNAYNAINQQLEQGGYNYGLNGASVSDKSYFVFFAPYNGAWAYSLFISNQYELGVTVPVTSGQNVVITEWYTNYPSSFFYCGPTDGNYNMSVQSGTWNKDGYTYHYKVTWPTNYNVSRFPGVNNTYDAFLNGSKYNDPNVFAKVGSMYNSSKVGQDVISFRKVANGEDALDLSKAHSYADIDGFVIDIGSITAVPDASYIPNDAIDGVNYPIIFDVVDVIGVNPIPFPDSEPIDEDVPVIEYPLPDTVDPGLITDGIPIISGLQNKFPFSIPWDLYNLVNGLSVTRETPSIYQVVHIPIIEYNWVIDLDLSMYDDSAELFRSLFLILFIIGLAVFSYQHFFGS